MGVAAHTIDAQVIPGAKWVREYNSTFWYLVHEVDGGWVKYTSSDGYSYPLRGDGNEETLARMREHEIKYLMGEEPWQ